MRLRRLSLRVALAGLAAGLLLVAPLPEAFDRLQLPVAVTVLVCALGKALYDTFFYDHYRPLRSDDASRLFPAAAWYPRRRRGRRRRCRLRDQPQPDAGSARDRVRGRDGERDRSGNSRKALLRALRHDVRPPARAAKLVARRRSGKPATPVPANQETRRPRVVTLHRAPGVSSSPER
ncbi:MAG: hypothetical protein KatS3mg060_3111 [Dehalococcoidia bacterium]|nr:MAG: hypothetical protein KatS3mg060_3111 [Dehalococcoidia bacterium]